MRPDPVVPRDSSKGTLIYGLHMPWHGLSCGVMPVTTQRSSSDSWIMRHPLTAYLLLVFAIGWVFWVPLAIFQNRSSNLQSLLGSPIVIVLQTVGAAAPVVSAIVVTGMTRGRRGIGQLLSGMKRWRVGPWWYAVACLLVPALTVVGIGIRAALGVRPAVPGGSELAAMLADVGWIGLVLTFPLQLLVQCFGSPLLEEPGWRGFALPRFSNRVPAAWAALLVGAIWGFWQLPLLLAVHENLALSLSVITMEGLFLGWLSINTRSLLIAVLGHASLNVSNNTFSLTDQGLAQVALTFAACAMILAFFRVEDLRPRMGRSSLRIRRV
jgi:membrane protease YdiL (CAAX protease family)